MFHHFTIYDKAYACYKMAQKHVKNRVCDEMHLYA